MMRSVRFDRYGGPEVLRVDDGLQPEPGPGQLLIAVAGAGVNPADWRLRSGQFRLAMRLRLPFTPGHDAAGRIAAVGSGVQGFQPGDEVIAMTPTTQGGAYAEYLAVEAGMVALAPRTLPLPEAAALPLAGLTALQALRDHGGVRTGTKLLVVGASGGVGHLAVQISKALGAHVTAMSSTANLEFSRTLGADDALSYEEPASFAGPGRFDVVLDAVAMYPFIRWRRLLAPGATVVTVHPLIGKIIPRAVTALLGVPRLRSFFVQPSGRDLANLSRMVDDGRLRPVIQARFSLSEAATAHRLSAAGHVRGKLLLEVT